jgi:hypothetical protein
LRRKVIGYPFVERMGRCSVSDVNFAALADVRADEVVTLVVVADELPGCILSDEVVLRGRRTLHFYFLDDLSLEAITKVNKLILRLRSFIVNCHPPLLSWSSKRNRSLILVPFAVLLQRSNKWLVLCLLLDLVGVTVDFEAPRGTVLSRVVESVEGVLNSHQELHTASIADWLVEGNPLLEDPIPSVLVGLRAGSCVQRKTVTFISKPTFRAESSAELVTVGDTVEVVFNSVAERVPTEATFCVRKQKLTVEGGYPLRLLSHGSLLAMMEMVLVSTV